MVRTEQIEAGAAIARGDEDVPLLDEVDTQTTPGQDLRRFRAVCIVAILACCVPYLWVLWDLWTGTVNPLRLNGSDSNPIYDVQGRAIMHGHLWLPGGSISAEAFVHDGRQYTYFGVFPSLLRIPFFLFTHSLDGRLFALSLFGAWVCTAVFTCMLLWRLRILLRGGARLGWCEAVSYGVLLATILVGSVLVYLASRPDVYSEDLAWSVALACGSLFALVGVVEQPSRGRVLACGILVLLTNLNRATTGYSAILGALLIAIWFATGRAGPDRRSWAVPVAMAALVPLAVGCAINYAKFGSFFGVPVSSQLLFKSYGFGRVNGGHYFGFRYLPATLQAYVDPTNFRVSSLFPFVTLGANRYGSIDATRLFATEPTASVLLSAPLLVGCGIAGLVSAFMARHKLELKPMRLLLVSAAMAAGPVMLFGWIYERFVADFMPFLVLSSALGMVAIWNLMDGRSRARRIWVAAAVALLGAFGVWSNMAYAITPDVNWTHAQLINYLEVQRSVSDVTGHPLDRAVVVGDHFPADAPLGTLYIKGNCAALYVADENTPSGLYVVNTVWSLVERAPDNAFCRSLLKSAASSQRTEGRSVPSRPRSPVGAKAPRSRIRAPADATR